MPSPTDFNLSPYFDDFAEAKKFHRILFRPGFAVQARELTQLQTILQNQIERFGRHIFKEGSMVIPGEVNIDNQVNFAKLEDTFNEVSVTSYLTQFRNKIITGVTSGVKATVNDTSECTCMVAGDSDIPSLFFKYTDTASDGETKRFLPGETLVAYAVDNTTANNYRLTENQATDISVTIKTLGDDGTSGTTYTQNATRDVIGRSFVVEVKEGVYFVDGTFVKNDELHLYISRFNNKPTFRVGFEVTDQIITPGDDASLNDNAQGSSNVNAPGAHRLKINLSLKRLALESEDEIRFVELIRIKNGVVQRKITRSEYSELEKTFARRTFDESGNYEVNKFLVSIREHLIDGNNNGVFPASPATPVSGVTYGDDDKVAMVIDPGKAYIEGYEVENTVSQYISVNRARPIDGVENGHVARLDDQPVGTLVGNYILVENVRGVPGIDTFETVNLWDGSDVYDTPPTVGTDTNASKTGLIGTARVRSFQLHSGSYSSTSTYRLSLFDIKLNSGKSVERDVKWITDAGQTGVINFYASTEQTTSVVNVNGSANGSQTSSGGDPITGTGTTFTTDFQVGDSVILGSNFVGYVASVTNNTTLVLDRELTGDLITATGTLTIARGKTRVYESEYANLIFRTGLNNTKTLRGFDSATGQDVNFSSQHEIRRVITNTADGSGNFEATLTNTNEFFLTDQNIDNYTLFDNVTNQVVNISASDISFDDDSNRKTVTISGLTSSRSYTLITTILQINLAARERTKTLVTTTITITGAKNVTAKNVLLNHADVYSITSVSMKPGDYTTYSATGAVDVTSRFNLDTGQRSTHYQKGSLTLKEGAGAITGALSVTYKYFSYSGSGNYFSVDSYLGTINYEDIPSFKVTQADGTQQEIYLHDVIDYRPVIEGSNSFTPQIPKIGSDFNTPLANYLPRADKVFIDSTGEINVLSGTPAEDPKEPSDPKSGMVIATLYLPAYTKQASDVTIKQKDNRRYTMRDIGNLERRISNLEYYSSLSLLEKETEQLSIKDAVTGIDKFKNGFIVDQFTGHNVGDVKHPDYKIAVDSQNRELRPRHFTESLDIVENLQSGLQRASQNYQRTGDIITLPYTENVFIFNPYATRAIDVNPYKIGAFRGQITLFPEVDNWKETDRRPDLTVTDDNNLDAIRFIADTLGVTGTQWNEWQNNWTGSSTRDTGGQFQSGNAIFQNTITTFTGTATRDGIRTSATTSTNSINYGDRVVDVSYIPYIRPRPVTFVAQNLKPDTKVYGFFDQTDVNSNIKPADKFNLTKVSGAANLNFTLETAEGTILADDPARADDTGVIQPAFTIGDVIKNSTHTATTISAISNITSDAGAASFTLTVNSADGILPGHHVYLYNLDASRQQTSSLVSNLARREVPPTSTITTYGSNHSKQLNERVFKVTAKSGTTLTLANVDGSTIDKFDSYSLSAYTGVDGGKLKRLQASGVVAAANNVVSDNVDTFLVNIINGFAIGETVTGTIDTGGNNFNTATITSINDGTSTTTAPTMKSTSDVLRTDTAGQVVGVFNIPENTFRTGERTFKLTDNQSNSDALFDSAGTAIYGATGLNLEKEATVVNSRSINFAQDRVFESRSIRRSSTGARFVRSLPPPESGGSGGGGGGHDPLAQTFTVDSPGGVFVSSVDLYFSETGSRPVIVELRVCDNGVPTGRIIPFTTIVKRIDEINTSTNGTTATNFKFKSPVYLRDGETYAIVAKVDEPGCQMFVSELGQTDLITTNVIGKQPLTGSLYASQNTQEFVANPLLDMKFRLNQCTFNISQTASVSLKALPPETHILETNPFEFTTSSTTVRVKARNHGFTSGDVVVISGVPIGLYGTGSSSTGAPETVLNGSHTVLGTGLTRDSFLITLQTTDANGDSTILGTTANFVKGFYGGSSVRCTRQLNMDTMYYKNNDIILADTSMNYFVNATNLSGTATGNLPIVANQNYDFKQRMVIKSYENETLISSSPQVKTPTLTFLAQMTSTNPNVSPVIDLLKQSVYAVANLVDNKSASDLNVDVVDERALIEDGTVVDADSFSTGSGTITTGTGTTTVTGSSTSFTTQVKAGDTIRVGDTAIGVVSSVTNDTSLELTANGLAANVGVAYKIVGRSVIEISENADGNGQIVAWIDAADNILANAQIGANLKIEGILASKIDGTYAISNVEEVSDNTHVAESTDGNKVTVTLGSAFTDLPTTNTVYLDVVNDWYEFNLNGTHVPSTGSTTITSTADNTSRINVGDKIISTTVYEVVTPDGGSAERLEKKVIGTVTAVDAVSITLASNATEGDGSTAFTLGVRKDSLNWAIKQYDSFVDDYAPTGSTNLANYITRTLVLETAAENLRILFDATIPQNTNIKVYYRVWDDDVDLTKFKWTDTGFSVTSKDPIGIFSEREINVANTIDFKNLQLKIVMKSSNTVFIPKIKDLRVIAYS